MDAKILIWYKKNKATVPDRIITRNCLRGENNLQFWIVEELSNIPNSITSRLPEKSDNAILDSSERLTTVVIDKHKNRDIGNTSERQFISHCLQYVYSENVSDWFSRPSRRRPGRDQAEPERVNERVERLNWLIGRSLSIRQAPSFLLSRGENACLFTKCLQFSGFVFTPVIHLNTSNYGILQNLRQGQKARWSVPCLHPNHPWSANRIHQNRQMRWWRRT